MGGILVILAPSRWRTVAVWHMATLVCLVEGMSRGKKVVAGAKKNALPGAQNTLNHWTPVLGASRSEYIRTADMSL